MCEVFAAEFWSRAHVRLFSASSLSSHLLVAEVSGVWQGLREWRLT